MCAIGFPAAAAAVVGALTRARGAFSLRRCALRPCCTLRPLRRPFAALRPARWCCTPFVAMCHTFGPALPEVPLLTGARSLVSSARRQASAVRAPKQNLLYRPRRAGHKRRPGHLLSTPGGGSVAPCRVRGGAGADHRSRFQATADRGCQQQPAVPLPGCLSGRAASAAPAARALRRLRGFGGAGARRSRRRRGHRGRGAGAGAARVPGRRRSAGAGVVGASGNGYGTGPAAGPAAAPSNTRRAVGRGPSPRPAPAPGPGPPPASRKRVDDVTPSAHGASEPAQRHTTLQPVVFTTYGCAGPTTGLRPASRRRRPAWPWPRAASARRR